MSLTSQFILASASPRRAELLGSLGLVFDIEPQSIDESRLATEDVESYVMRLAIEKAQAVLAPVRPVLGADTVVVVDGDALGKPANRDDCLATLQRLSGRQHQVMTAVALLHGDQIEKALNISQVTFRDIEPREAEAYWRSGEPRDKAGSYAIQGLGGIFVSHLEGSYSGVVGLPVFETIQLMERIGIRCLPD